MNTIESHQPDVVAPQQNPSVRVYAFIALASLGFIAIAFVVNGKPDWSGLLLNISAGLISALVVLLVIERRFRESEVSAIREAPIKFKRTLSFLLIPSLRATYRYASRHLEASERLLAYYVEIPEFDALEADLLSGCNLLAPRGAGKTIWMQSIVAKHGQTFVAAKGGVEKVLVLLPLREWPRGTSLEQATLDYIKAFAGCSNNTAKAMLKLRVRTLLLDGYNEILAESRPLESEVAEIVRLYPDLLVTVSSGKNYPIPINSKKILRLPGFSIENVAEIKSLRRSRSRNAEDE